MGAAQQQDFEGQAPAAGRGGRGQAAAPAGPVPRTADGKPDLRGHWIAPPLFNSNILEEHAGGFGIQAGRSVVIDPPDGKIPYQPWALAQRDENRKPENAYLDNEGRCVLAGVPRILLFSFSLNYLPDRILFISDYVHHTRNLWLNRKEHLPTNIRLWMGDALAHWEGDTLVVDIANLNGRPWFALGGDFMTDKGHIVERYTMSDSNTLNWTATITDPATYTRPWTMTTGGGTGPAPQPFRRGPDAGEELEDTCHEGNADLAHLKNNYDQAQKLKAAAAKKPAAPKTAAPRAAAPKAAAPKK
jgi:hypothetical protein